MRSRHRLVNICFSDQFLSYALAYLRYVNYIVQMSEDSKEHHEEIQVEEIWCFDRKCHEHIWYIIEKTREKGNAFSVLR